MEDWKQAFWLAKFELKASAQSILIYLFVLGGVTLFFVTSMDSYLENNYVGFDLFFILAIVFLSGSGKPRTFAYQKINSDLRGAPGTLLLKQLPVKHSTINRSRLIIHFFSALPFQLFFLIILYFLNPALQGELSLSSYLVFLVIWLSFGIYAGAAIPAADTGDRMKNYQMAVLLFFAFLIITAFITTIQLIADYGIIQWTIIFAEKWPWISASASIILAVIGVKYWENYMKKTINNLDYL